jgi:hypothetical protein
MLVVAEESIRRAYEDHVLDADMLRAEGSRHAYDHDPWEKYRDDWVEGIVEELTTTARFSWTLERA